MLFYESNDQQSHCSEVMTTMLVRTKIESAHVMGSRRCAQLAPRVTLSANSTKNQTMRSNYCLSIVKRMQSSETLRASGLAVSTKVAACRVSTRHESDSFKWMSHIPQQSTRR